MKPKKHKNQVRFFYYVKDGRCIPNTQLPKSVGGLGRYLAAYHVLRNQSRHLPEDVAACRKALKAFLGQLKADEVIMQKDLLEFV
jgi:hypothetical protein